MTRPRFSYSVRSPLQGHRLKSHGDIRIALVSPQIAISPQTALSDLEGLSGVDIIETTNLETAFVLQAIAKSLTGESGGIGAGVSITPVSMAFGSGVAPVTVTDDSISNELLRKYFATSGTITRAGSRAIFRITLGSGEAFGPVGTLGLFAAETGSGSLATGTITVGGSPSSGNSIVITLGGRTLPPYFVGAGMDSAAVGNALRSWLSSDDSFRALYVAGGSGATITVTSVGKGTVFNQTVTAQVTGGVTVTPTDISGGTTPGGQLLAAANTSFRKTAGQQLIVEWSINISN